VHDGAVVAEIVPDGRGDFPWMSGTLTPLPGFARYLLGDDLNENLTLVDAEDGTEMTEFRLRLDGDRAVFRWTQPD
jgi:hypothetical protein